MKTKKLKQLFSCQKRHFACTILVAIISWAFGWSLYGIKQLTDWSIMSDIVAGVEQNFYMKFFYDQVNSNFDAPDADKRIVIVNIHGCTDDEIAEGLLKISRKNPSVVGIDKLFYSHNYTEGDLLLASIDSLGDKLVSPMFLSRISDSSDANESDTIYASYHDKIQVRNIGSVHLRDYYNPLDSLDDYGCVMFDYLVARESGFLSPDVKKYLKNVYINYRDKTFNEIRYKDIEYEDLNNKIVLVGDLDSETEDSHVLPFKINNDNSLCGLRLLAYSINSMIAPWNDNDEGLAVNRAYCNAQSGETFFISFLAILLFSIFYHLLYEFIKWLSKVKNKSFLQNSSIFILYLITPFVLLAIEVFTIILCYKYTDTYFIIPNLLGLMFSYFCVSIVYGYFIYYYENYENK